MGGGGGGMDGDRAGRELFRDVAFNSNTIDVQRTVQVY